jgi:Ca2+-binding EF-hand superfamily protein
MMKEFLIGAAAIVVAGAAVAEAQPAPTPQPVTQAGPATLAPPVQRDQTRAEVVAKVRDHFAQLDTNRDGSLTRQEADAGRQVIKERIRTKLGERREHRTERRAERLEHRDPNQMFDRLDTNKDGAISRDEFAKGHEQRVERRIVLNERHAAPGAPGTPHEGMRMHRFGGMMGGHMFDMADANKDGRVTLQEATDAAVRHFDMADANRDGRITPDERRQMHRQMIEKRRAPTAG